MKKFKTAILSVVLVGIGFIIGLVPSIAEASKSSVLSMQKEENGSILNTYILTDTETKIQYIVVYNPRSAGTIAITPRIAYDNGTLYKER